MEITTEVGQGDIQGLLWSQQTGELLLSTVPKIPRINYELGLTKEGEPVKGTA